MKSHNISGIIQSRIAVILVVVLFMTALSFHISAQRKVFIVNNSNNPLKNFSIPLNRESHPFFIDIDKDGDLDCFSGEYTNGELSKVYFYRNDGNNKYPVFKQITGTANPLNKVLANTLSIPYFIDIDGDGDYDCFVGDGYTGAIMYYKNTGTATHPVFEKQSAATNPLSMIKFFASGAASPAFADIDGDGDYDCLVVDEAGSENYFENTGTTKEPVFVHAANSKDPFYSLASQKGIYNVSFEDWNRDGLIDVFVNTTYYKNIGTKIKPAFAHADDDEPVFQNKAADKYTYMPLRWVDLHNDGNVEVFRGNTDGSFIYQTLSANKEDDVLSSRTLINVFPNPAKEEFTLNIPATSTAASVIRITDLQGKLLTTQIIHNGSVKFGKELKRGVYVVQIMQNNKVVYNQKIIKE